ncbi:HU-CCDC81 and SPOR domain-containing protein [Polaribacter pectinis]|uniref:HU-CCDC81 and SPOR domain-containing protein n=1 Tax=Polaribacter pectinis TaxID=2738844 RepID=A0A7G9L9A7_9FLAO|nr:SPOR domain-containing protein [Polaribacter pectinis]QNM85206.1 HU-CCDC81 and SPOR domain-containing protein [Polaribacter pectinis]
MILANYINDLLYRYDCVIVPDFGGFVTNKIGAKINSDTNTFYPPTKQITFNSLLKHNDGLLANYIASSENISFDKASTAISLSVIKWQNELQSKSVEINNLGFLSLNEENQIVFEPNTAVNYLTTSFGLSSVESSSIKRYKEQVKPLIPAAKTTEKKGVPAFIKYAATAAILLTLGFAGYNGYQQNEQKEVLANQQKDLEKKIQSATFVISNPLPTIELNVVKETAKPYHIVAGAFQFPENAQKKVNQLKSKGFDAKVIGVNKWGLTQVTFNSYSDRNDAINNLYKIQDSVSKDAWLLVKKVD